MSQQYPRSQTGLIPASHKRYLEDIACQDNWSRLPPRPPPVKFPYRGDCIGKERMTKMILKGSKYQNSHKNKITTRKEKKSDDLYKKKNVGTAYSLSSPKKHERANKQITKRLEFRPDWDTYICDKTTFQESVAERKRRGKCKKESLLYIRDKYNQRCNGMILQKILDYEIYEEIKKPLISSNCNIMTKPEREDISFQHESVTNKILETFFNTGTSSTIDGHDFPLLGNVCSESNNAQVDRQTETFKKIFEEQEKRIKNNAFEIYELEKKRTKDIIRFDDERDLQINH